MTRSQVRKREQTCRTKPVLRRLRWMAAELRRKGEMPNCRMISVEHEICAKTVNRDIALMRDFFDYPIEYDPKDYKWKLTGQPPEPVL